MPVDIIKKVGNTNSPTTMDYNTLQAWANSIPLDLTTTRSNNVAGSSTTSSINLDAGASATDNFYTGHTLTISGQTRVITNYVGATKTATVGSWNGSSATYPSAPTNGTPYVVDDVRCICECYDQGTLTVSAGYLVQIPAAITDSTRNVIVRCAAGASFNAKAGVRTTALAFNASNGVAWTTTGTSSGIGIGTAYIVIDGIQYQHAGLYGSAPGVPHNSVWQNGIISANQYTLCTAPDASIINTLIVSSNGGVNRGTLRNCTIIRSGSAGGNALFPEYTGYMNLFNCAVFNFVTLFAGGTVNTEDYNATNLSGTWPLGTHDQVNLVYANQFVSAGSDWRAVGTGNLVAGTPDALVPTDITGATRSVTTPTIGCWEVATSGTAQNINAAPGSYTETGSAVTPKLALNLNAVSGAVSVTGFADGTKLGLNLLTVPDVYTITGQPVPGNIVTATLNLVPGSYNVIGFNTNPSAIPLVLSPGSYSIAGSQAYLKGPLDPAFPSTGGYNGDFITEI